MKIAVSSYPFVCVEAACRPDNGGGSTKTGSMITIDDGDDVDDENGDTDDERYMNDDEYYLGADCKSL